MLARSFLKTQTFCFEAPQCVTRLHESKIRAKPCRRDGKKRRKLFVLLCIVFSNYYTISMYDLGNWRKKVFWKKETSFYFGEVLLVIIFLL